MEFTEDLNHRIDEMVKLLAIIARRSLSQTELILQLKGLGFAPKRIAELVGTTPNVVSVTLHKSKRGK
jgi:DNA-directed RNA polymerase specialized sigma24 family protein